MDTLTAKVLAVVADKRAERRIRKTLPGARLVFADVTGAVDAATRSRPDVIVLDVALPAKDGFTCCRRCGLRRNPRRRHRGNASGTVHASSPPQRVPDWPTAVADCFRERTMYAAIREAIGRANEQAAVAQTALTLGEQRALESGGVPIGGQLAFRPLAARAAKYHAILTGSLNAEQAARRLGVSTGRIRQRLLADPPTLYGIRDGNVWRLPAFQFVGGLVPHVDQHLTSRSG
jgi:CheY-like chemotaxis protein